MSKDSGRTWAWHNGICPPAPDFSFGPRQPPDQGTATVDFLGSTGGRSQTREAESEIARGWEWA